MLGITTVAGNPKKPLGETSLNPDQLSALESAIGRNFTVIWGPPGTGKTFTIGTITEQLYKLARTVLIVSHTNTAVDQAIKHVADSLKEYIEQGAVIRIGDVRDQELKSHYPDVLLKRQVERQSQELVEHKDALTLKKQLFLEELNIINKNISILDWLEAADLDIQSSKENIQKFHRLETQFRSDEKALAELEIEQPRLVELHKITSRVLELRQAIANKKEQRDHLKEQLSNFKNKIGEAKLNAQKQQSRLEIADRIAPLKIERAKYPSIQEQKAIIGTLYSKILELKKASEDMQQRYNTAYDILSQLSNISNFRRILKRLPKPEEQKNVIDELFRSLTVLETESNATSTAHNNTVNKLSRILELDAELSRYDDIGSGSEELKKLINIQNELRNLEETGSGFDTNIGRLYAEMMELEECERTEAASINGDVHAMDQEICSKLENIEKLKNVITPIHLNIKKLRKIVNFTLNGLLTQVSEWLSIGEKPVSEDDKFDLVRDCCKKLMEQQETSDLQSLKKKGRFYSLRNS
jgi:hypothetical protein